MQSVSASDAFTDQRISNASKLLIEPMFILFRFDVEYYYKTEVKLKDAVKVTKHRNCQKILKIN